MGDQTTTSIIELVVVAMGVAVGMVYLANNWPSPEPPLMVAGVATGAFVVYMVVAAVLERRRCARVAANRSAQPQAVTGGAQHPEHPEQPEQAQPMAQTQQSDEQLAEVPVVAIGAPSEDPTAFLQINELRAETDADITPGKEGAVPDFAQNTMNFSQRDLARGAGQLRADGDQAAAGQPAPKPPADQQPDKQQPDKQQPDKQQSDEQASIADQKTELTPIERLRQKIESEGEA